MRYASDYYNKVTITKTCDAHNDVQFRMAQNARVSKVERGQAVEQHNAPGRNDIRQKSNCQSLMLTQFDDNGFTNFFFFFIYIVSHRCESVSFKYNFQCTKLNERLKAESGSSGSNGSNGGNNSFVESQLIDEFQFGCWLVVCVCVCRCRRDKMPFFILKRNKKYCSNAHTWRNRIGKTATNTESIVNCQTSQPVSGEKHVEPKKHVTP